jgi:membrane-associated phospholipid phosphatase
MLDQSIAEFANRIAQHQPARLLALAAATWLLAVPLLALLWLAVAAIRRRQPQTLTVLVLAIVGALAAFGLHQLVDHLYFRPRPYWALPAVHAIGARRGDSSFFSLEAAIAAALAAGLLLAARRWGLVAAAAALLVGLGQVATGANYPFDVAVGLAVGVACTAALLPLRHRLQAPVGRLLRTPVPVSAAASRRRELRVGIIAVVLLVGLGGWLAARIQDHGLRIALNRADARLAGQLPTDARLYRPTTIDTLAAGRWRPTRARVYGQVTYVNRELDGDVHVVLKAPDGAFVVLEIIPELPIPAPHDDRITAWGIVRHDGLHNWWELHPLIGWAKGHITAPATGGLDD